MMFTTWTYSLGAVLAASLLSLVGVFSLGVSRERLNRLVGILVSFAAGTLLGDAFLHLIPEASESDGVRSFVWVLLGIIVFFVLEKFIHWQHCHEAVCEEHPHTFSYMIVVGDAIHNFIDGAIIAASFLASVELGIATTLAVILHEIPQEIGDFGALVYGGFSKAKALAYNFLSSLTAFVGAILVLAVSQSAAGLETLLVPFAAGGFVYIASADIIPELHKTTKIRDSALQLLFLLLGIGVMGALLFLE